MAMQSVNKVTLEGKLIEISHKEGVNKNGDEYVAGEVMIQTSEDNIIPVGFYQNKNKKDGNPNPVYKGIQTLIAEAKTVARDGIEAADAINVGSGQISENSYYPATGTNLVRGFRIGSPFYKTKAVAEPQNAFVVSGTVINMVDEVKDSVPTGRLLIDLLVVGYGDRGEVIRFVVEDPKGVSYIKNSTNPKDEVKLAGTITFREVREEKKEEVAFGDPIIQFTVRTNRELVVTSATASTPTSLTEAEMTTMLSERENRLAEAKKRAEQSQKSSNTGGAPNRGFSL